MPARASASARSAATLPAVVDRAGGVDARVEVRHHGHAPGAIGALCCGRALSLSKGGCFARHDVARGRREFRAIEPQVEDAGLRQQTLDHREGRGGRGDLQLPIAGELLILDRGRRRSQHGGGLFGLQDGDDRVSRSSLRNHDFGRERPIDQFAVQQRDLAGQIGRGQLVQRGGKEQLERSRR